MIKGKYVAMITIDIEDVDDEWLFSLDEAREFVEKGNLSGLIQDMITEEIKGIGKVRIDQMYANLVEVEHE